MAPNNAQHQLLAWQDRMRALRDFPRLLKLLWDASRVRVASTIVLRILGGLIPLGMLFVGKQVIDLLSVAAHGTPINDTALWTWVGLEFGLAALSQVVAKAIDYFDALIAERFSLSVGLKVMHHAATLDLGSFEDPGFQDRLERARAQTTDRIGMLTSTGWLLQRIVMLVSLLTGIMVYAPWLLPILTICAVPSFLVESHFAFLGYMQSHELTPVKRAMQYYLTLGSAAQSAKEVKVFALSGYLEEKYRSTAQEVIRKNSLLAGSKFYWSTGFTLLASIGYYGSYAFLAREALAQRISLGTFTFLVGAIAGSSAHLQTIFSLFSGIADQALFLRDLITFLDERPSIVSPRFAQLMPRTISGGIEFENVTFHYPGSTRLVLDGMNLRLEPGERVALVGENGEGKSTVVKLLTRLYDPVGGRILLDGKDLRRYNIDELRKEIGIVFQDFIRYDLSARENIAIGNISMLNDDEAIWDASRKSNSEHLLRHLPEQLDQILGRKFETGVELSGGEWQRVALARAYLRDAPILILDEPSAALDAIAESEVFQKFAELSANRIALFISHRFSSVKTADRIAVLSGGQITELGNHRDLMQLDGHYAKLFEVQASSYR